MPNEQITIRTRRPLRVATPAGDGPWPAVIFYMDAGGIRPIVIEMAQRLASAGYVVLLPDLFYRYGPYGPLVPKEVFAGDVRAILGPMMATTGNNKAAKDTEAFLVISTRAPTSPAARSARWASAWAAAWHSPLREPILIASGRSRAFTAAISQPKRVPAPTCSRRT